VFDIVPVSDLVCVCVCVIVAVQEGVLDGVTAEERVFELERVLDCVPD